MEAAAGVLIGGMEIVGEGRGTIAGIGGMLIGVKEGMVILGRLKLE